ncbi:MAG: hypothetical protein HKN89_02305 [Eudoraea sp.]|nr:hypothetical protein [Eudoraea sp.]
MRYKILFIVGILVTQTLWSQEKRELERRITREAFPQKAFEHLDAYLEDAKHIKYYEESDGTKTSFEVKLKKGKLWYSIEYNPEGQLEDVEIRIKEIYIPSSSVTALKKDLDTRFNRYRIRKIQQQYLPIPSKETSQTLREAFQNLLFTGIRYELIVGGKIGKKYQVYEIQYDAEGGFLNQRIVYSSDKRYVLY